MKPVSLQELVGMLTPGERVFVSGSAGEPTALTEAIATTEGLPACHYYCSFIPGVNKFNLAGSGEMTVNFMQPGFAKPGAGKVNFAPMTYSQIGLQLSQPGAIDTVLVQVAPPDAQGRCSVGPQGEFLPGILANKPRILALINPNVPSLAKSASIALEDISAYAEVDTPLACYDAGSDNAVSQAIADSIASLLPDGAALQCGLGKVPNQLMKALANHRNLRIHSGMVSDGLLGLLESGSVDMSQPIISTVALGSESLYPELTNIEQLEICGVERSHNAAILAATPKLFAVNSALEVDLTGQVNAEMLGGRSLSGPGGLPDFAAAARAQADGLSIIALPAADPKGEISRLVAKLPAGTPVSVPQYNVDVLITEFGIAHLRGADLKTRAKRIIDIAHPNHRASLEEAFFQ